MFYPPFQFRSHPSLQQQQSQPPVDPQAEQQANEQSEVVENTAMWQAAANLTTAEYAYARYLKIQRESGKLQG